MKKLYTIALAAAVALSASAAVKLPAKQDRLFKVNLENTIKRNVNLVNATKPEIHRAASATDAPADLEGMQFIMTYSVPEADENNEVVYYPQANIVTFTDGVEDEDGYISYLMEGFAEGIFNSSVTLLPLEVYYNPSIGQLEIYGGDFLEFQGTTYQSSIFYNVDEDGYGSLNPNLPLMFAWEDGKFEWISTYGTSSGTVECDSYAVYTGNSLVMQFYDFAMGSYSGDLNYTITVKGAARTGVSPISATVADNTVTFSNWFDLGFDGAATFTIDAENKTLTGKLSPTFEYEGYNCVVAAAENKADLTDCDYAGAIVANYTVENGKTTVTLPDWNVFVDASSFGYPSGTYLAFFYPFSNSTLVLNFDLGDDAQNGISDVVVDNNENAPVEYFNLQGVRINEPAAGQVVIRRQGNKTTKLFVK